MILIQSYKKLTILLFDWETTPHLSFDEIARYKSERIFALPSNTLIPFLLYQIGSLKLLYSFFDEEKLICFNSHCASWKHS